MNENEMYDLLRQPVFQASCDIHGNLGTPKPFHIAETVVDVHRESGCNGWFHIFKVAQSFEDISPPYPQDF